MTTLVIRFSSFGDIVLTAAVTGALAPVRFLTLRQYVPLASTLPGVIGAVAWEDGPELGSYDRVVDLHASLRSRRIPAEARVALEKTFTYANHLGLFAEEVGLTGEQLGNFPQAFTHLALISAALNLDRATG